MPRVSVVVPAYNSVAFIDATMRSILTQTFSDFELVVSDHSSTDGTWEALQQFTADPRVRLSRLASGGGAPANFNAVTDLATGEFVKLVCGDEPVPCVSMPITLPFGRVLVSVLSRNLARRSLIRSSASGTN